MAPIVLVHGAWHGGWCRQRLAPLLRDRGHEVHRPTLTGLGDRAHLRPLLGDALGLDTHVDDVVLVGHSYGGIVITGVADRVAARLGPQPVRTFSQPLPLGPARALPRTYLHCTAGAVVATLAPFAERVREDPAWDHVELDAGHDVMLTAPDVLAAAVAVGR